MDLLGLLFIVGAFGTGVGFWVARGAEVFERPLLVKRTRATMVAMADLSAGSLLGLVIVDGEVTTTGGWVLAGFFAAAVLAGAGAAVAIARGRLWPPPVFPERVAQPTRRLGEPRPVGGAHAGPASPLWSGDLLRTRPWRVGGGVGVLVVAGVMLALLSAHRDNPVGVVLCGVGVLSVLVAVGLRSPLGVLLAWTGVIVASTGTFAGWLGELAFLLSLAGPGLVIPIYDCPAAQPISGSLRPE